MPVRIIWKNPEYPHPDLREPPLPEGPEIRRAADKLAAAIAGQRVTRMFFAFDRLQPYARRLQGETVCQVTARGKAILTRFSNGLTLYTHNPLYGRWLITTDDEYPVSLRQLRLAIHTEDHTALLYSASDISILNDAELRRHPYISRLGPDLLDPGADAGQLAMNDQEWHQPARVNRDQALPFVRLQLGACPRID
jgi:endonuclease-8